MHPFRVSGALLIALTLFSAACGEEEPDVRAPTAHITALSQGFVDHEIRVDGSGSVAHSKAALTYSWTLENPDFSSAALSGVDEAVASFIPDAAGEYKLSLVVKAGKKASKAARWTINVVEDPNQPPVAHAGGELSVHVGKAIRLDGSQSHDPDGQVKAYIWSLIEAPEGSEAALEDETSSRPNFVPDRVGDYKFELVVSDGHRLSQAETTLLIATNDAPMVTVGQIPSGLAIGDSVQLPISAKDPEGDAITFAWELEAPTGSAAALDDATAATPRFTIDRAGEYVATVTASDAWESSAPVRVAVVVNNRKPVAHAGHELVGWIGESVNLEGTASDADGHSLTYAWTLVGPAGSAATLINEQTLEPTFIPDVPGTYTATLVANDGQGASLPSSVIVVVQNRKPTVRIALIPTEPVGNIVQLRGIGNDEDGHQLTWEWTLLAKPEGSTAIIANPVSATPSILVDRVGTYQVSVTVHDGFDASTAASTRFESPNRLPTVNAGQAQTVNLGDVVTLQGTTQDMDNQELTTTWTFASRPSGSAAAFSTPDALETTFAPDKPGIYNVNFKVFDGVATVTSSVVITVENRKPVANAGADGVGHMSEVYTLVGTGTDADPGHQDILVYTWSFVERPTGSTGGLTDASKASATFTPNRAGTYVMKLRVSDTFDFHEDTVSITVANRQPTVDAGADKLIHVGDVFTAAPVFTDPDKQTPIYTWTIESKPATSAATLTNADKSNASFTADKAGLYVLKVVASDGALSAQDTVTITVHERPIAVVTTPLPVVLINDVVTLNGAGSSDPNGGTLTYAWTFVTRAPGSTAVFTGGTTATPTFPADKVGDFKVKLTVTNGNGGTGFAETTVKVRLPNAAPVAKAGGAKTARVTDVVTLDGSTSTDAEGAIATFAWALDAPYAGVVLTDASLNKAKLVADTAGVYTVNLTVTDGEGLSHTDSAVITIVDNQAPVAVAGADKAAFVRAPVLLQGSATDPETDAITARAWSFVGTVTAAQATLTPDAADPSKATFTALVDGVYTLRFSATDDRGAIGSDDMTITATWQPPSVQARANPATVAVGSPAALIGEAADSYGGQLVTFYWRIITAPAGSTAAITNSDRPDATFTPDKAGFYVLMFGAEDANHQAAFAAVTLQATSSAPVASISAPNEVEAGVIVQVDGSGSTDSDGTIDGWKWEFVSKPRDSAPVFDNPTASLASFSTYMPGTYVVKLTVTDNAGVNASTQVTVIALADPIADAGVDQSGYSNALLRLDGSASTDPMGGVVTYSWALGAGVTDASLINATAQMPQFLATRPGVYPVILTVTNAAGRTGSTTILVTIVNSAPIPNLGEDFDAVAGVLVEVEGTATDVDGDAIVGWEWTLAGPADSEAELVVDPTDETKVSFIPDLLGEYTLTLVVEDEDGNTGTTDVVITAKFPTVAITAPELIEVDEEITLEATVTDLVSIASWTWTLVDPAAAVTIAPVAGEASQLLFTAHEAGAFSLALVVEDDFGNTHTESFTLTVVEAPEPPEDPIP